MVAAKNGPDRCVFFTIYIFTDRPSAMFKVAVNTIVPRSPFFFFLYPKVQTVTNMK